MAASKSGLDVKKSGPQHKALFLIREKLERVLHSKRSELAPFRPEVDGILDALDALNRESIGMRRHGHRGEHEGD